MLAQQKTPVERKDAQFLSGKLLEGVSRTGVEDVEERLLGKQVHLCLRRRGPDVVARRRVELFFEVDAARQGRVGPGSNERAR